MILPKNSYWTQIINLIIQDYIINRNICVIWDREFEFVLKPVNAGPSYHTIVNIDKNNLIDSFINNVINFEDRRQRLVDNGVIFNDFVEKLTASIEESHCEVFLVFQKDILEFVETFTNASKYSIWRSQRNQFIFVLSSNYSEELFFNRHFFKDQARILVIENIDPLSSTFKFKTNKYVGPRLECQEQLYLLDSFDAETGKFRFGKDLFPDKFHDFEGREVVLAAFDYRPAMVLKYDSYKNVHNRDLRYPEKYTALLDGTEVRILLTFCEKYNCTVEIDTTDADDWGVIYPNASGDGALGMITDGSAEVAMGAMYTWHEAYTSLDMSVYLSRSGITCIVPVPKRLTSWFLPLEPFQFMLWVAVLLFLFIEAFGISILHRFQKKLSLQRNSWFPSLIYGCITTFKLFISQPNNEQTKSASLRVFLFACFMNDIIISSIYDGGLASILTIPSFEEAADSLERLRLHHLKWAANSEAWVSIIRGGGDPKMDEILNNFNIYTDGELQQLSKTEYMGFTVERQPFGHFAIGEYLTPEVINRFKIMQDDIYFQYTVTFVPRLWSMLERYDQLIYLWHSSGFDKFWEWRIVADNLNSYVQKEVEASMFSKFENIGPVKLGMANFAGILLIWFIGIILSVIIFVLETLINIFYKNYSVRSIF